MRQVLQEINVETCGVVDLRSSDVVPIGVFITWVSSVISKYIKKIINKKILYVSIYRKYAEV